MLDIKTCLVIFTAATYMLIVPASSQVYHLQHEGSIHNESYSSNVTREIPFASTNDKSLFMNYIYRPVELTVKTVSAVTLIPQQRVACLTLAIISHGFLLPKELTLKEHVITAAFWVLIDSLETHTVVEYTGEVKEFGDLMTRVALLPVRILGSAISKPLRVFRYAASLVADRSGVITMPGDFMVQTFNDVVSFVRPLFAQDDLLYISTGNDTERLFYPKMSTSTVLSEKRSALHTFIYSPVELTVKTVSAVTLIPQQRVACFTLAIISHGFLLPKELTLKEHVITAAFWVFIDSLETHTVVEYTGEVKEFGDMIGRIALLPLRVLSGFGSLLVRCTFTLVRWSWIVMSDCLAEVIDVVMYLYGYCWTVLVELSNYWILPLFVQEDHGPSMTSHVIHGINTVVHVFYFMVKLVVLDTIGTIVFYSWSDTTFNYIIHYYIDSTVEVLCFILEILEKHWQLISVGLLACLLLYTAISMVISIFTGKAKRPRPKRLRVVRKRRY